MQFIIVLGQIPGTNYQASFNDWLTLVCLLTLYFGREWVWATLETLRRGALYSALAIAISCSQPFATR